MKLEFVTYPRQVGATLWIGGALPEWEPAHRPRATTAAYEIGLMLALIESDTRRKMTDQSAGELKLYNRQALHNMITGHPSPECLGICITAMNLAMLLCELEFGYEYIPLMNQALEGCYRAKVRGERTGKWGFDGPAIAAIKEALDVHEVQLEHATKAELLEALDELHRREAEGHVYSDEDV